MPCKMGTRRLSPKQRSTTTAHITEPVLFAGNRDGRLDQSHLAAWTEGASAVVILGDMSSHLHWEWSARRA